MSSATNHWRRKPRRLLSSAALAIGLAAAGGPVSADFAAGEAAFDARDFKTAFVEFSQAARAGNPHAQYRLGGMYARGTGLGQDDRQASRWYRLAAEQGNAPAQVSMGLIYAQGRGVARNNAEAMRWYRLAAAQDAPEAQFNLGVIFGDGIGVARDDREAARWYSMAATQGDVAAQLNLGLIYARSGGPLADRVAAYMWLAIAAKSKQARESRNRLAAKMTPQQIEEAKTRVKTCRASGYLDCG